MSDAQEKAERIGKSLRNIGGFLTLTVTVPLLFGVLLGPAVGVVLFILLLTVGIAVRLGKRKG